MMMYVIGSVLAITLETTVAAADRAQRAERSTKVAVQAGQLIGTWLHSREEDTPTQSVYRPVNFDFPPARVSRPGYELKADGSCTLLGGSAHDGWSRERCTWELRPGDPAEITLTLPTGRREVLRVLSADQQRLLIQK
jgi:hypothetical protein